LRGSTRASGFPRPDFSFSVDTIQQKRALQCCVPVALHAAFAQAQLTTYLQMHLPIAGRVTNSAMQSCETHCLVCCHSGH
jgi:hypothetical protein